MHGTVVLHNCSGNCWWRDGNNQKKTRVNLELPCISRNEPTLSQSTQCGRRVEGILFRVVGIIIFLLVWEDGMYLGRSTLTWVHSRRFSVWSSIRSLPRWMCIVNCISRKPSPTCLARKAIFWSFITRDVTELQRLTLSFLTKNLDLDCRCSSSTTCSLI